MAESPMVGADSYALTTKGTGKVSAPAVQALQKAMLINCNLSFPSGIPMHIKQAFSDLDLVRCFPIMVQLRPHLSESEFTKRVLHQHKAGYSLVYLEENGTIKAVAGFRILEKLSDGRQLYVDDLITNASERSSGYGSALLDWLVEYAKSQACSSVQLDSGVQRAEAHRFYERNGMKISAFHFNLSVNSPDQT